MSDRELLEQAAKAAGIAHEGEAGSWLAGRDNPALLLAGTETVWNPLRDDGDALRLAVKLDMMIARRININGEFAVAEIPNRMFEAESVGDDSCAATRRAIVRAAASLAEGTKP